MLISKQINAGYKLPKKSVIRIFFVHTNVFLDVNTCC